MELAFYKYQGTGNDFIILDNRDLRIQLNEEQIKFLCDRRFGIGADGLMLLQAEPGHDFRMIYFNSDGNQSSMCGNGGRCIAAFAKKIGLVKDKCRFMAIDGLHEAVLFEEDIVALKMQDVKDIEMNDDFAFLNTGSPHYVKSVSNLNQYPVSDEGRNVRYSKRFKDAGTNVNFIEKKEDALHVRTYERGVEDETFSCGTGVTAAALVAAMKGISDSKNMCRIQTLGGKLEVTFDKVLENNFYNIWLKGPAQFVFTGTITLAE
ncbi:MAG: diaminopimelate epimerase [Sphingobacteriaceae bacterium]|nr:diaminopimelate epimerase [Sphingobacteriaceae bacterium]